AGDFECRPLPDPSLASALPRGLDGGSVAVEAPNPGVRICVGHHDHRRAMSAADVGHASASAQLVLDSVERGDPRTGQVGAVSGAEEPLGALEQAGMMIAPWQAAVAFVGCLDLFHIYEHGSESVHRTGREHWR